jgi:phage terminase large subunit-like protein
MSDPSLEASLLAASLRPEDPTFVFKPLPQQQLVVDSQTPVTIAFGGNRAGKSDTGAFWTIENFLKQPHKKMWACTVDEPLSIRVQMAKIHNMLPANLKRKSTNRQTNFYYNYTSTGGYTNNKFTLTNGTSMEFKFYSQDVKTFQGEDLDAIWFDETPPKPHYDECTVRLWDRGGRVLITNTATEGVTPWVRDVISDLETKLQRYAPLVRKHLPVAQFSRTLQANVFYLWTLDNPHIDHEAVMRKAKNYSTSELELRLFGIPSNLQGLIYPAFQQNIHIRPTPPFRPPPHTLYIHALDPHDRKSWCMGWYAYTPSSQTLHILNEYPDRPLQDDDNSSHMSISDYVRVMEIIETQLGWRYQSHRIHRVIDPNKGLAPVVGDQVTESIIQSLARKRLFYTPAKDGLFEGHNEVREHLNMPDPTEPITDQNQPRLFFSPLAKNHIYQFSNYAYGDHRTEQTFEDRGPKETPKAKYKDFPDLVRYVLMHVKGFALQAQLANLQPDSNVKKRRSYI